MKSFIQYIKEQENLEVNGFCLLKPGFTQYDSDLCTMLKNNGWKVISKIEKKLSKDCACELYKGLKDKDFYNDLCDYMASDKCMCYMCYKDCDNPVKDMKSIRNKVRKAWGEDDMKNAMHSSDSLENVNREYKLIFAGNI